MCSNLSFRCDTADQASAYKEDACFQLLHISHSGQLSRMKVSTMCQPVQILEVSKHSVNCSACDHALNAKLHVGLKSLIPCFKRFRHEYPETSPMIAFLDTNNSYIITITTTTTTYLHMFCLTYVQ